jgi:Flp pilus assembly pilin Flp
MAQLAAAAKRFVHRLHRHEGQTMAEYAVILTLITAASLAALLLLSGNITTVIGRIADLIK